MKFITILFSLVLMLFGLGAQAAAPTHEPAKAVPAGIGTKGYVWNQMTREQADILKLTGDFNRGKVAFQGCRGCHRSDGSGRTDGTYPRLTGQHAIVIIKQVTDTRAGLRVNPKMGPFAAEHAVSLQELADIALYLSFVQSEAVNGKGAAGTVASGKEIYFKNKCAMCHGKSGQGDEKEVYPVLAGQHYAYLLRELKFIRDGSRGNSHPDMVKIVKKMTDQDFEAVSSYLASLPDYRFADKTTGSK